MSGKIITRVRKRQARAGHNRGPDPLLNANVVVRDRCELFFNDPPQPPIIRLVESETPGAYASDPISRFFRWVFRL